MYGETNESENLVNEDEFLLVTHENLCHAFPSIGSEVIWEVLTSFEFSIEGIEKSINAIMEMSGNKPINFDEMEEIELNSGGSTYRRERHVEEGGSRIERFDKENNFNPLTNYGNSISNFAANIWSNIRKRTYASLEEEGDCDGVEMTEPIFETKKDI